MDFFQQMFLWYLMNVSMDLRTNLLGILPFREMRPEYVVTVV